MKNLPPGPAAPRLVTRHDPDGDRVIGTDHDPDTPTAIPTPAGSPAAPGSPAAADGPAAPDGPVSPTHVLDNAVLSALRGAHAHLAEVNGLAARYRADVAPFAALAEPAAPGAWADLAALAGPSAPVVLAGDPVAPPPGWTVRVRLDGVQMTGAGVEPAAAPEAEVLGPADVPEILDLVARTEPGPYLPRTVEMGRYLGIRRDGALIAMAGERLRPDGWTEVSAVCTDPAYRGQGLAGRLIRAVAEGIRARGEAPFLHAAASNTGAIRLYEKLGFTLRRTLTFSVLSTPGEPAGPAPGEPAGPASA
jgi:ribosomal protein S18 acetylase RimI-like enzyme